MYSDNIAPGGFFMQHDQGQNHQGHPYQPHNQPNNPMFNPAPQAYNQNIQQQQQQNHSNPYGQQFGAGQMYNQPPQQPQYGGAYMQGQPVNGSCGFSGNNSMQQLHQQTQMSHSSNNTVPERRKAKVFTPVTVKMVRNAQPRPDDVCEYDGDPINDIIICGLILRRIEEPMRTQFEINDHTGTFYVLFYHKGENQIPTALKNFEYQQFCYVKVYGNIRVFKEEKAIVGTHIKKIQKFDELTNHFLSTCVSHCIRKKGILKPRELNVDDNRYNNSQNSFRQEEGDRSAPADFNVNGVFNIRKAILEVMKHMTKTQKFVNKHHLYSLLQDKVNLQVFDREIEQMMSQGQITHAFDKNHYCLTN